MVNALVDTNVLIGYRCGIQARGKHFHVMNVAHSSPSRGPKS
jgi:hypothetical protein